MDSSVAGEHEAIREQAAHVPEPEPGQVADAWAALGVFVRTFMALAPQTREIVAFRVLHPEQSLRVCAKRLGVTVQSAHQRLKLAVEKWPALASVIRIHERGSDGSGRETVEG